MDQGLELGGRSKAANMGKGGCRRRIPLYRYSRGGRGRLPTLNQIQPNPMRAPPLGHHYYLCCSGTMRLR
jgi:hypothetical protein